MTTRPAVLAYFDLYSTLIIDDESGLNQMSISLTYEAVSLFGLIESFVLFLPMITLTIWYDTKMLYRKWRYIDYIFLFFKFSFLLLSYNL